MEFDDSLPYEKFEKFFFADFTEEEKQLEWDKLIYFLLVS